MSLLQFTVNVDMLGAERSTAFLFTIINIFNKNIRSIKIICTRGAADVPSEPIKTLPSSCGHPLRPFDKRHITLVSCPPPVVLFTNPGRDRAWKMSRGGAGGGLLPLRHNGTALFWPQTMATEDSSTKMTGAVPLNAVCPGEASSLFFIISPVSCQCLCLHHLPPPSFPPPDCWL